jgi:hypothetical protein
MAKSTSLIHIPKILVVVDILHIRIAGHPLLEHASRRRARPVRAGIPQAVDDSQKRRDDH